MENSLPSINKKKIGNNQSNKLNLKIQKFSCSKVKQLKKFLVRGVNVKSKTSFNARAMQKGGNKCRVNQSVLHILTPYCLCLLSREVNKLKSHKLYFCKDVSHCVLNGKQSCLKTKTKAIWCCIQLKVVHFSKGKNNSSVATPDIFCQKVRFNQVLLKLKQLLLKYLDIERFIWDSCVVCKNMLVFREIKRSEWKIF